MRQGGSESELFLSLREGIELYLAEKDGTAVVASSGSLQIKSAVLSDATA